MVAIWLTLALATAGPMGSARLTPDGLGQLRIGMSERQAARRFHLRIPSDDGVNSFACRELEAPWSDQLVVMAEGGRISRITLGAPGQIKTDRGLGVGSTEAEVRRAYRAHLRIDPSVYEDLPARYFTIQRRDGRGIRYETDERGRVARIHAGGPAITYIEGCL